MSHKIYTLRQIIPFPTLSPISDLTPGRKCKVICDAGWVPSPGAQVTTCQQGGHWNIQLSCEIPLLVLAGGLEKHAPLINNTIEVMFSYLETQIDTLSLNNFDLKLKTPHLIKILSLYPSEGCDNIHIPDLLPSQQPRGLHNIAYDPSTVATPGLVTCNNIGDTSHTTCDHWSPDMTTWGVDQSSPHRESEFR